jgi:hypothetical protein
MDEPEKSYMVRLPALFAAAMLVAGSAVHAIGPAGAQANKVTVRGASTLAQPVQRTSIVGHAWAADNTPVKDAKLRLRNTATGQIEATTVGDDTGRFTFVNIPAGSYVVEMVDEAGQVLAVGHSFAIAPGETVGTFVRIGTRVPWFTGFFSNTAAAVASAAASQGITALAPVARPASSRR